jgi:hypothetical protein
MADQRYKIINKKVLDSNENENMNYQNLWDTEKAMLRGKFIFTSTYIKKKKTDFSNKQLNHAR